MCAQEITGKWQFNSITNIQGDTLIKVTESDFMDYPQILPAVTLQK